MKILRILRFLIATPGFLFALFFFGMGMIICRPFTYRYHHRLFRNWARMTLWSGGVKLKVTGTENLDMNQQYVFACNHQSLLDVPSITQGLPMRPRFVAKSSLEKIFFFGEIMRQMGTIAIDRKNHEAAIRKLLAARSDPDQANAGIVFFAEGTRTSDGEIGPFKKGPVMTALSLQVPIVPMAIAGAFHALPKGSVCLTPGPVHLAIGKPIPVGENTPEEKERLMQVTRQAVLDLYEGIRHDMPGGGGKCLQPAKAPEGQSLPAPAEASSPDGAAAESLPAPGEGHVSGKPDADDGKEAK